MLPTFSFIILVLLGTVISKILMLIIKNNKTNVIFGTKAENNIIKRKGKDRIKHKYPSKKFPQYLFICTPSLSSLLPLLQ